MSYAILLNLKVRPDARICGFHVTKNKTLIAICCIIFALDFGRIMADLRAREEKSLSTVGYQRENFYVSYQLKDGRLLKLDLLRFAPTIITFGGLVRKIWTMKSKSQWKSTECAHMVYILCYLMAFMTVTIIYIASFLYGDESENLVIGFQDSKLLAYVFVYTTCLVIFAKITREENERITSIELREQ